MSFSAFFAQTAGDMPAATSSGQAPAFSLGHLSCTHDAMIAIAVIMGVAFVLSFLVKRLCARLGARMALAHVLVATAFRAGARFSYIVIFSLCLKAVTATDGLSFGEWQRGVELSSGVLVIVAFTVGLLHLVSVPVTWFRLMADKTESKLDDMLVPVVATALRVLVILGGMIEVVHYLSGNTPTQIIAALGVGGLAIGLAAQDTIKNFFGSIMLIVDKPFTLGDVVNIGSHTGTVESLGLRSTRIRTVDGHLVSVPNGDLANRAIQNVTERRAMRHQMSLGLEYSTSVAKLEEACAILKELLDTHEGLDSAFPARVHLEKLADFSINIQVVYWYHPADYWKYMDFNQRLLFAILRRFEAADIRFAFPTQTIDLRTGDPKGKNR